MAGKCRAIIEDHIFGGIKGNALAIRQRDRFALSNFLNNRINTVRLDRIGRFPGEAQHAGAVGAVALAGEGQRAMERYGDARGVFRFCVRQEAARRHHGPHRVGA